MRVESGGQNKEPFAKQLGRQFSPPQPVQRKLEYNSVKDGRSGIKSPESQKGKKLKEEGFGVTLSPKGEGKEKSPPREPVSQMKRRLREERNQNSRENSADSKKEGKVLKSQKSPQRSSNKQFASKGFDSPNTRGLHDFIDNQRSSMREEEQHSRKQEELENESPFYPDLRDEERIGLFLNANDLSFSEQKMTDSLTKPYKDTPKFEEHTASIGFVTSIGPGDLKKFSDTLKVILVISEKIEECKNVVYRDKRFRMLENFKSFDFEEKGYLTLNEFSQLFNSFSIKLGRGELVEYLKCILKKQFIGTDTRLSDEDLARCFAPVDQNGALVYSLPQDSSRSLTSYEVSPETCKSLEKIVQLQMKMHEEIKSSIKQVNYLARRNLFQHLCTGKVGEVEWQGLVDFLASNGVNFYEQDILFIFQEFGAKPGKTITEEEFLTFFKIYGGRN